ncbi:MAG: hypothetical protein AB7K24_01145 [Gemmataceae bacterium]
MADMSSSFNLDDFRKQFEHLAKLGGLEEFLANMPGFGNLCCETADPANELRRVRGMIDAMTPGEREQPDLIDDQRLARIGRGSGNTSLAIRQFLVEFEQVRGLMRYMGQLSMWQRVKWALGMMPAGSLSIQQQPRITDLSDLRDQLRQALPAGISRLLRYFPALRELLPGQAPQQSLSRVLAMLEAMTPAERLRPDIVDSQRRCRIAQGSGTTVEEVKQVLEQFARIRLRLIVDGWNDDD